MKTTIQHDQKDCGAACLHMIAKYYGCHLPIAQFRGLTKTDREGVSAFGLVDAGDKIGLSGEVMEGTFEELVDGIRNRSVSLPFIAHTVTDNNMLHFVVVSGYKNGHFIVNDPAKGKLKMDEKVFLDLWTGHIITFALTEHFVKQKHKKTGLLHFQKLVLAQWKRVALAMALSMIISVVGIVGAFVFQVIIDNAPVSTEEQADHTHDEEGDHHMHEEADHAHGKEASGTFISAGDINVHSLATVFILVILMYFLAAVIQYWRGRLIISVSEKIDLNLTLPYYNRIVDMPVHAVEQRKTGDYMSRFSDAATIREAISTVALTSVLDALMAIGCGIILYIQNRQLFVISIITVLLYAVVVIAFRGRLSDANREYMIENAAVQAYLKESVDGIETVKATVAETKVKDGFYTRFAKFVSAIVKRGKLATLLDSLVTAIQSIGIAVILWCGFKMVLTDEITLGSLISFYALLGYFISPVKNLIGLQPVIQTASVAAERLSDILDASIEDNLDNSTDIPTVSEWKLDHIDFRYGNNELTLKDISMSIRAGEKVAIVGESGCGKTTLAKLLLRFNEYEKGEITADGVALNKYSIQSLRRNISYVSQDTYLFSGTIRLNLLLGNPDASEEDLERVCKLAGADEFIRRFPMGFDTIVEENGANLSGGQKQRLAIARALLKKPQLLILDEATSNLDTRTENAIKQAFYDRKGKMACLFIAHRLSTIRECDRIYVMHDGEIMESGSHEMLAKKGGKYTELLQHQ